MDKNQQPQLIPESIDIDDAGHAIVSILRTMHSSGLSYELIAENAGVKSNNIKKLASKDSPHNKKFYRKNRTLSNLYFLFTCEKFSELVGSNVFMKVQEELRIIGSKYTLSKDNLQNPKYEEMVNIGYKMIYEILNIRSEERKIIQEVCGEYFAIRNGKIPDRIVISEVIIRERPSNPGLYEFVHNKRSRWGGHFSGDGLVFLMRNEFHLLGDVEMGKGLDHIVIKRPMQENQPVLFGLTLTSSLEGESISARIGFIDKKYALRDLDFEKHLLSDTGVFDRSAIDGSSIISRLINTICDEKNDGNVANIIL